MKEIKFRQPIMRNRKFEMWHYWGFLSRGNFSSPSNDWVDGDPSQQYTGLKDKNGKEIYEGDIVRGFHQYHGEKKKNEKIIEVKYKAPHHGIAGFHIWPINFDQFPIEVIGNIYENGELLKETIEANKKTGLTDKGDASVELNPDTKEGGLK